eukprot:scaffold20380_cov63-Phaeocystis_antarctica.AAC.1
MGGADGGGAGSGCSGLGGGGGDGSGELGGGGNGGGGEGADTITTLSGGHRLSDLHGCGIAIDAQFDIAACEVENFENPVDLLLYRVGVAPYSLRAAPPYPPRRRGHAVERVAILYQVVANRSRDAFDRY